MHYFSFLWIIGQVEYEANLGDTWNESNNSAWGTEKILQNTTRTPAFIRVIMVISIKLKDIIMKRMNMVFQSETVFTDLI